MARTFRTGLRPNLDRRQSRLTRIFREAGKAGKLKKQEIMLDEKFTKAMQAWLMQRQEQRSLEEGALLLLRINRNQRLYSNIIRKKDFQKLEYELNKHLKIRLEGLTREQVAQMERTELPRIKETLAKNAPVVSTDADFNKAESAGKRSDHDTLPEQVQRLYDRNGELYFKMKSLFETIKTMEDQQPCDRHELLVQLAEMDREYRENWNAYDTFDAATAAVQGVAAAMQGASPKEVSAARRFISGNKTKLSVLKETEPLLYEELRDKMQERVDLLIRSGLWFKQAFIEELTALGVNFKQ